MGLDRRTFLQRVLAAGAALLGAASARRQAAPRAGPDPPRPGLDAARRLGQRGGARDPGAGRADDGAQRAAKLAASPLPSRPLGSTGVVLPVLALGGFHVGDVARRLGNDAAHALVAEALEEGVRFFDTAEQYQEGGSERLLGEALADVRDEIFLMTKTHAPDERSADGAWRHLEGSLERLRTDRLDLWQLHAVQSAADVDRAFGEGGAMRALLAAKEQGTVRFVGVTGHATPAAHLAALRWFDRGLRFDAMQFPLNPIDAHQVSFQRELLAQVARRGIAVIAMKTSASGALLERGVTTIEENLRYALSLECETGADPVAPADDAAAGREAPAPRGDEAGDAAISGVAAGARGGAGASGPRLAVSAAVVGMESPEQVRRNAAIVRGMALMPASERDALVARIAGAASLDLEWYKAR